MNATLRAAAARLALPFLMIMAGCGMVAAPQPPSLKLPNPVTDLTAQRTGDQVELHWTMPKRTTDNVILTGDQKARIYRQSGPGHCATAGKGAFAPLASAVYVDRLPAELTSGDPRALIYTVELENRNGRSAGPSNSAETAAGSAPPQVSGLRARTQADGVVLSWTPKGGTETVRIKRKLEEKTDAEKSSLPMEQTLEFSGPDRGRVLDRDVVLDHTYTYSAQRILKTTVDGKSIEVASMPSETITIDARDLFPPATPAGLQAVADPEAGAIDLSWQPDTEADLAGYFVYRREAGAAGAPVRITPTAQSAPSFHDTSSLPGHTYEYSVSAVDRDGNESSRSAEVEESLPTKQGN